MFTFVLVRQIVHRGDGRPRDARRVGRDGEGSG
jgi:hypothetical protein